MKKMILLAWTMFRGTQWGGGATSARKRRLNLGRVGNLLLMLFVAVYVIGLVTAAVYGIYGPLSSAGIQSVIPALVVSVISIVTFLFGAMYAMSVYYHASDVDKILPLPFTPGQIIFAKFLTTLLYEYLLVILAAVPALITYGVLNGNGAAYYVWLVLTAAALPVTPLALSSVLVVLLMRFSPAARNKDRFNMISNILIMAVTLGIVFGLQSVQRLEGADLAAILANGTADIARVTAGIFPGSSIAATALADPAAAGAILQMAGFLLIGVAAVVLLMLCARMFYLKGVMGVGASFARRRKMTTDELQAFAVSGSALRTYALKDLRILLRTPIYFLNNVLMNFLFPLFFIGPVILTMGNEGVGLGQMREAVRTACFGADAFAAPIALGVISAAAIFVCGMNGITASAISREGSCAYVMKYIPMPYRAQIWAKILVGVLISIFPGLILLVMGIVLLTPPAWFLLPMLFVVAGALLIPNLMGILFDLRWPKLTWTDEQKAVKQNLNVLYTMVISLAAAALAVVPAILIYLNLGAGWTPLSYAAVLGFPLLADIALLMIIQRSGPRMLRAMQA